MQLADALQSMISLLDSGTAVLLAGNECCPAIPTIHNVGSRQGQMLRTPGEIRHAGFGLFLCDRPKLSFDGGGAMRHVDNGAGEHLFSWTPFRATRRVLDSLGYPYAEVQDAVRQWIGKAGQEELGA